MRLLSVSSGERSIGVIAGNGIYPETFIKAARREGIRIIVAAFKGETKPEFEAMADEIKWFRVGQLGGLIKFFCKKGAKEAIMVGQIAPRNLFDLWPDLRTLKVLHSVKERNAESLFGAIANELNKGWNHSVAGNDLFRGSKWPPKATFMVLHQASVTGKIFALEQRL